MHFLQVVLVRSGGLYVLRAFQLCFITSGPPPTRSCNFVFSSFKPMFYSPNNPESTLKVIINKKGDTVMGRGEKEVQSRQ